MATVTACKTCGKEFNSSPNQGRKFCSRLCCATSQVKHGGSKTKLYFVWNSMRQRCGNPANDSYADYGARGVKVCPEWNDFAAFQDWAYASGYQAGLQIDRINNNGGYSPENCRWVTPKQNTNNTRGLKKSTSKYKGVCWCSRDQRWLARISHNGKSVHLGNHKTGLAAAIAYDNAARQINGEFALLNFPERKRITT